LAVAAGLRLMPGPCSMPSCRFPLVRLWSVINLSFCLCGF